MQDNIKIYAEDKKSSYEILLIRLKDFLSSEMDWLANLANASALLYQTLENINWAGFYFNKGGELVLGPFQGKIACTRIKIGRGVCGTAALKKTTIVVDNVHEFSGHIACDSASNSEIVVPIIKDESLIGVLDIDSPQFDRFDAVDSMYLEKFVDILNQYIDWTKIC